MVQVYYLFRQLGLRHIFVVPRASRVIGMITRKDLLIEVLKLFLSCSQSTTLALMHNHILMNLHGWLLGGFLFICL